MTKVTQIKKDTKIVVFNFDNTGKVHPAIKCARNSPAYTHDSSGRLVSVAANVPRIDHDPLTGKCLGLLCEGASTNYILHSCDFTQGLWSKTGLTVETTGIDSPIPGIKAMRLRSTNEVNQHWMHQNKIRTNGAHVVGSFLVKYEEGGAEWICLDYSNYAYQKFYGKTYFNLKTGETRDRACKVIRYPGGWYRIFIDAMIKSTVDNVAPESSIGVEGEAQEDSAIRYTSPRIRILSPGSVESYEGSTLDTFLIAHVQDENIEEGTSIIVTGASSVLRNTDMVTYNFDPQKDVSGVIRWSENFLNPDNDFNANRRRNLFNFAEPGAWNSRVMVFTINNTLYRITTHETAHTNVQLKKLTTGEHSYAFSYDSNTLAFRESVNGENVAGNVQVIDFQRLTRISFGHQDSTARSLCGHIKSMMFFDTTATDTELKAMSATI